MRKLSKRLALRNWLVVNVGTLVLRLWFATCRVRIIGPELHRHYILGDGGLVGATWHRGAIFLVWFFRHQHPMIMFSRSRDGEMLARFAARLGVVPVRGSSSRGGGEALKKMHRFLSRSGRRKVATVLDGPQGPAFVAKKGMIVLAMRAAVPLLPIIMTARPAITLKNTWDQTLIPLPFSRVTVCYRQPWVIAPQFPARELETLRREVEDTLNDMMREAEGLRDGPPDPVRERPN